ncbi:MAG: hypothetical protein F6K36_24075, partial [Symploca sp. SIO3C6]|nr:hypothetical protein [Symploca sp. SIO3C6]
MLKIMTLGDSLTWGVVNDNTNHEESGGYRTVLEDSLLSNGFTNPEDFDFVGTRDDTDNRRSGPDSLIDQDHQGHRGWTIDELLNGRDDDVAAGNIDDWLVSEDPDLVLLMAGTNDVLTNSISVAEAINNLESLINKITDSGAQVLVGSIPPVDETSNNVGDGESAKVIELNEAIANLVTNLNSDQVQFIDINSQLDLNDVSSDGIHLSLEAYSKIATIWHNALLPFLDPDTFDPETSASRETPVSIEAEDFDNLVEFAEGLATLPLTENSQIITDISVIELPVDLQNPTPITGTATTEFTLPDGNYDVVIGYFDENDGVGTLQVSVGDTDLPEFDLDQDLGSGVIRTQNFVRRTVSTGVEISNGDQITITGTSGFGSGGELVRIDYIEFIPVNDSPILNASSVEDFTDIEEDPISNQGNLVSEILATAITDIDTDAVEGIAVTEVDNTNGSWEYSTDGGSNWTGFDSPSATEARLLAADADTRIRFVPDENYNDEVSISFRAWDRTKGLVGQTADTTTNGGSSAFSEETAAATITVNPSNDAPVLAANDVEDFNDIDEDPISNEGNLVSEILATAITDIDTDAVEGIAVTEVDNTNGSWEYSTDSGSNWTAFGTLSATEARLLAADINTRIRFVPDENYSGEASISFRAWDQSEGVVGDTADTSTNGGSSAFSEDIAESTITVNTANDAPVLVNEEIEDFTDIEEDPISNQGNLVSEILSTAVTDIDTDAVEGIAVTEVDNTNGSWEYSTDSGSNWTAFGTLSVTVARLLAADADTRIRFVPNENYSGEASVSFRAWDQSEGVAGDTADTTTNGGSSAFSEETAESTITVNPANDAPVLIDDDVEDFTDIDEDPISNEGNLVSEILSTAITDIDTDAVGGIAVTEVDNTNGSWEYSTDSGSNWTAFGTLSVTVARLLAADADTRIRFVPNENYSGEASVSFRAWDQSEGVAGDTADTTTNGGSSAFSEETAESTITVNPANDAPVLIDDDVEDFTDIDEDPIS